MSRSAVTGSRELLLDQSPGLSCTLDSQSGTLYLDSPLAAGHGCEATDC